MTARLPGEGNSDRGAEIPSIPFWTKPLFGKGEGEICSGMAGNFAAELLGHRLSRSNQINKNKEFYEYTHKPS